LDSLEDKQDWENRLKRIEGQVRGLQSMMETSRSCSELMIQISSVKSALHQLGVKIFETHLREEFQLTISLDNPAQSDDHIKEMLAILSRSFK